MPVIFLCGSFLLFVLFFGEMWWVAFIGICMTFCIGQFFVYLIKGDTNG